MIQSSEILKEFSGGLRMRRVCPEDTDRLCAFNARIHGEDPFDGEGVAVWTRDLLCKPHPSFHRSDYTLVEDSATGEIVSSMNLITQTWAYDGISFGVGRPELVGTDPNYRGRGLVRAQFDVLHAWSQQRGELLQVITGIPYFYRQFGYEMGLELGGGIKCFEPQIPPLGEGQDEPYLFRPAVEADIPFLMRVYEQDCRRSLVSAVRSAAHWHYELFERSPMNVNRYVTRIIQERSGQPVGYLIHAICTSRNMMAANRYALVDGVSYLAVTPSMLRFLWKIGQELAPLRSQTLNSVGLRFGSQHPAYAVLPALLSSKGEPYAYYVRVADVPAFLRCIAPALEKRLSESVCAGHSGELKISFYRTGVRLLFENGRLSQVDDWKPAPQGDTGAAAFPNLTFLQLLFGYRTLAELRHAYADCSANETASVLLTALFPQRPSSVWGIS